MGHEWDFFVFQIILKMDFLSDIIKLFVIYTLFNYYNYFM